MMCRAIIISILGGGFTIYDKDAACFQAEQKYAESVLKCITRIEDLPIRATIVSYSNLTANDLELDPEI